MSGIICDNGVSFLNTSLAQFLPTVPCYVELFTNNHTPTYSDTYATYTVPTFSGYGPATLVTPVDLGETAHIDTQQFAPAVFTALGGGLPVTIYGYMITQGGNLIAAEKFSSSVVLSTAGQSLIVVPSLTYQDRSIA